MSLIDLVKKSYSNDEAERYAQFKPNKQQFNSIASIGKEVLTHFPWMPGACAPMSAIWTAQIRDRLNLPAYCVAGDLVLKRHIIFGSGLDTEEMATYFDKSDLNWDGHCWVCVGDHIADISIFRTAYSPTGPKLLREAILANFGNGRGVMLASPLALRTFGLDYMPKYVLKEQQLNGLMLGAKKLLEK